MSNLENQISEMLEVYSLQEILETLSFFCNKNRVKMLSKEE